MPKRPSRSLVVLLGLVLFVALAMNAGWSQGSAPATAPAAQATSPAGAIGVYVYPKNNQDKAQQQKDETECFGWSKQQTGIDPAAPPPSSSQEKSQAPKGGGVKGAAGGAAAGAAVGAIAGDAGEGAAIGATAGAIRGRRQQKKAQKQAEQQAKTQSQTAQKQQLDTFRKAFSACMDARQYSVR